MSTVPELETTMPTPPGEEPSGWRDWTVVSVRDGSGSISFDYQSPDSTERKTWCDSGASVLNEHLDWLIDALTEARALVTGGGAT